ncbi:glucose 1-dehydrogenase [Sporosarcina thermotolerans]|uniref:Glucose 1-dehydrogenase n=1 Tax=Sporosarcina thermotolerans TaxID=633404 RepID=A0AAW9A5L1_9BACL|nr:glucose 1-dehydrogenase [Sporosarcina thermotolerans]MDW0116214.1 glucose 1-dehydrogenase [Sporosarcina thermotolerans]WHT48188.1 glucose 1-dehydrogenase [Sporosarcina thermotolerans]
MEFLTELFGLNGKVAIVTGSSRGIGKEVAISLAKAGADIALIARNEEDLNEVAREIEKHGRKALSVPMDLLNINEMEDKIKKIHTHFGKIDILVNNAGINIPKPALEVTEEDWDKVLDINLKSVFFLCKTVAKYMIPNNEGKIINMSSQMAFVGYYKRAAYSSSKGGLLQLTKSLAIEWSKYNINVNSIAPTFIETPMTKPMFEDKAFLEEVLNRIPLGRLGKIEDLFGAVIYLSSSSSDMVTGHTVMVDGGWTVW